ncbi:LEAF RUST 10 DISEASE-RESISTANCE LOCUS RECEPTOR-LIKE PROTEIN KINASE-like 1.1 isoform X5 [Papaver somniferum]|uniref:LEAF RUST 10 DISEASE-RESISTANCE LOCUS RECEPTOR-LIKE PROTEIN KINASE-like 1.1 isoform X5 n=1 Tax=Papaver somniferum TaxID=3469 RepID=UPI000E6FA2AC|nr:LEAF RUST 10 DISEASE-RESISTANCE LOCUS RECEPTOR-LIKE PROTEIN KINASE-like 1.1 isoform X5 [Papaver somniferum]
MIPILVIHFFIFLFLSSTLLADQEPKCEASDYCRVPGKVYPTYSNTTHHDCRDLPIDCTAEKPTLMATEEKRYQVKDLWRNKTVLIHDQFLQQQLKSKNCDATYITPSHTSSIFSFELISHNLTFFKCDRKQKVDDAVVGELIKYDGCPNEYILYYSYPKQLNQSQLLDFYSLPLCSKAFLPLIHNPSTPKDNNPFSLFTADFYWKWRLKDKCLECSNGGGHCRANNISGPSECVPPINVRADSKSKRKSKIAIGLGTGAGASLLTILAAIFIFRRWRQKNDLHKNSTLISRSISPDLSMQPDPEKGSSYFNTPIFSYKELEEATNNFDSSKELGDGGFGTVYYGKLKDGRDVAVKRLYENNCKRVEQFMNEVNILSLLRHQNLVSLYGCTSRHSRELLLVYEYVANGTVADHLHGEHSSAGMVTWPIRLSIAIESADALVYLHASDIIHRDVKTNNILLDKNFHVKVADFGLSRLFPNDVTHVSTAPQGTPGYVDPDYYQCYQLTDKSDVYSFGVVLCELISSKPAVDTNRHRHEINLSTMALNKIHGDALHELVDMSLGFNTNASVRKTMTLVAELAYRCLQQDTDARPSMAEVLEVLKEIEVEGSKVVKPGELTDDAKLLKNYPPVSPNSVTDKWASITSTPNTSS